MVTLKRKIITAAFFGVLLVVLLGLVLFGVFVIKPIVRHGEGYMDPAYAIHINADGDITDVNANSSSVNIHRDGDSYTLTGDIGNQLIIEKSNIIFDGNDHLFYGAHGLELSSVSNVTVKDLNFDTHYSQIWLDHTKNSVIQT
jgi:hypothetical protein